ncbi:uncharacterized protein [Choristoneura fumiferana]|uniref:uncharacterized protein n=1 Tax=Choristoneura fumiferana TaxID=7141 RepID=UPI003D157021
MPAGGQDYGGGGGGGGGYDANGQWQSRSIIADNVGENPEIENKPIISYVTPIVRYNNNVNGKKPFSLIKNLNDEVIKMKQNDVKSRKKRGIIDVLQNTYLYWINQVLGGRVKNKGNFKYPKFKIINGVKYVYYPLRYIQKAKKPKAINNDLKTEELKTVITAEDFNKGEIVEGPVESRMHKKKLVKMKDNVNETMDDNPWE